jgi:hypothetical protein
VRKGQTFDPLGTMREIYSYVREFLARQAKAGNGIAIVMTVEPAPDYDDEEAIDGEPPAPVKSSPSAALVSGGATLLIGANGRRYDRIEGKPQKALDETFARLQYRPLGDLAILPVLEGGAVRTYRSDDGTSIAAVVIGPGRCSEHHVPCPAR